MIIFVNLRVHYLFTVLGSNWMQHVHCSTHEWWFDISVLSLLLVKFSACSGPLQILLSAYLCTSIFFCLWCNYMLGNYLFSGKLAAVFEMIWAQEYNYLILSFVLLIKRICLRPVLLQEVYVKLHAFPMAQPCH